MSKGIIYWVIAVGIWSCNNEVERHSGWSLLMQQQDKPEIEIVQLPTDLSLPYSFKKEVDGIDIDFKLTPKEGYTSFTVSGSVRNGERKAYFSIKRTYTNEVPYNFNGKVDSTEIFRQSPHDVNAWITEKIAKQAIPVIALKSDSGFVVALNGSPAFYNNFTSQVFDFENKAIELSSGDNGNAPGLKPDTVRNMDIEYNTDKTQVMAPGKILPYYPTIAPNQPHRFEGILFETKSTTANGLRKDINQRAADHFSNGRYTDYFGALAFTTAYMNLRVNETGKSNYWVVPSVEYGNTQYGRDAFWISTMLSPTFDAACMENELAKVNEYAEYPLVTIIWAYRAQKANREVDLTKVQAYVDAIEKRANGNYFYSYLESDGRLDFQYWGDVIAFDKDDVVTYNQGLFALALAMAKEMGLSIQSDPDEALQHYQNLYNSDLGFFPISKKKMILGPDPMVPDLLSQLYFNKKMLDSEKVKKHYERLVKYSKRPFGFKIVAKANGDYLDPHEYDVENYVSQVNREKMPDGSYFRGGSYFLYDNLFLIDAYLHGIKEAEKLLLWRVGLDFEIGNTTYETLNTKTGEPWKPNMGWNVSIYAIWRKLIDEGKADRKLLDHINSIANQDQP